MEDKIILEGMAFYGYHGVHEEERRLGQRFLVDVELTADLAPAGRSDRIQDTIDSREAYKVVRAVLEGPSKLLLEALAQEVARQLLDVLPAQAVRVRIKKPSAPNKENILAFAAVEVYRRRAEA